MCINRYCFFVFAVVIVETYGFASTCKPVISSDHSPLAKIPGLATFRGSATVSYQKQRTIYQYLGIPFALPPMGRLRFQPPVPLKQLNENEEYDARYFKPKCPQIVHEKDDEYLRKNSDKAEDCLYLNVFTIVENSSQVPLLPVLVYIHGGGFFQGSASELCPNYLLDHDLILVTIQYRLGPLGYLNLDDDNIAGNMGLLDQVEALEWINRNIKYFGGDNKRITISGQSSGGNSVSLMLVSPLVRPDLFQQVIIQSGNLFGEWAMDYHHKDHGIKYASFVNCTDPDTNKLFECLITVPTYQLIKANYDYMSAGISSQQQAIREIGINHATLQAKGERIFLKDDPRKQIAKSKFQKIPTMTGVTKDEGSWIIEGFVDSIFKPKFDPIYQVTENQIQYLKNNLFYDFVKFLGISDEEYRLVELAEDTYLPDHLRNNFNDTIPGLVDLAGSLGMTSITLKMAREIYQYAPVYLYSFHFKGTQTKLGYGAEVKHVYLDGVAHSDELIYLYPYKDPIPNEQEKKVIQHMTALWASFITDGSHVSTPDLPKWPIMSTYNGPYLHISEKLVVKDNLLREYRHHVNVPKSHSPPMNAVFVYLCAFCLSYLLFF